ncbi:DUF2730 family protein [Neptunicella sp. SCSIO 80796]|uniref:DUF2730 family protein n=1 Tax=Neptunicella plasticusilytica TaxID=3117012 RepID=UPI003A4E252C
MDAVVNHISENWRFYTVVTFILAAAALFWLSKYFATKKDLEEHKAAFAKHQASFTAHKLEHYKLRDMVNAIDGHVKHLPTAKESQQSRETMAKLEGRLEGMEPLFKQILNNQNMLLENELRGVTSGEKQ